MALHKSVADETEEAAQAALVPAGTDPLGRRFLRSAVVGRDLLPSHGPARFFCRIAPWLACRRYLLFEGRLTARLHRREAGIPLRIAPASASELRAIFDLRPGFYGPDTIRDRARAGHVCFMAWEGDRLVHARWAFLGSVYVRFLGRTLIIPPGKIFYDEVYTAPDRRRHGADYATLSAMLDWFARQGFKWHAFLSPTWDEPLHRRAAAFGMRVSGAVGRRSLFDRRWVAEGGLRIVDANRIVLG
jgi:GNAT superfamily N-acetyltransferase